MFRMLSALALAAALVTPAAAQETLVVYWTKGFYPPHSKLASILVSGLAQEVA